MSDKFKLKIVCETEERLNEISEAIEKSNAKEPIYDDYNSVYMRWKCPHCGELYVTVYDAYHFCPHCGQKLSWK